MTVFFGIFFLLFFWHECSCLYCSDVENMLAHVGELNLKNCLGQNYLHLR